jgi:hypothetical protein
MNSKSLSVFFIILSAFVHIAGTDAQSYFHVMDSISEVKLAKAIDVFNDTLSSEQKAAVLLLPEYHNKISSFRNKWYSEHLSAMSEPVLYSDTTALEAIRFTWLRTFHHPVVVGMVNNGGDIYLYWKMCNGAGGYDPGKLVTDRKKRCDIQQWNETVRQLEGINFWKLPTDGLFFGSDGAQWIVEAKIEGKYHIIDRWSAKDSDIRKFCISLLSKSGLQIAEKDIY